MNAASIAGRTIPAIFVKRCGIVNLTIFVTIGMAALLYSLAAVKTTGGVIAFVILFGFFEGGGRCDAQSYSTTFH